MPRKRKIKPETRIANQRRDIRTLKSMLGWAAREFRRIAEASKSGLSVDEAATNAAAECDRWEASVQ